VEPQRQGQAGSQSGIRGFLPVIAIHARARRFYLLFGLLLAATGLGLLVLALTGDDPLATSLMPAGALTLALSLIPFSEALEHGERGAGLEALARDWERPTTATGGSPEDMQRAARFLQRLYGPRITG